MFFFSTRCARENALLVLIYSILTCLKKNYNYCMFGIGSIFAFLTFQYSFTVVFVKLKIAASILICIEHFFTINTNYDDIGATQHI